MDSDGVVYMDAGEHIDTWIDAPQLRHQEAEDIFIRVDGRAEIRSIGVQGTHQKADSHACK